MNRDFGILFLVMLTTGAGNTALQSVLPSLGRKLGVPDSLIAAAFSISAMLWVICAPYWARRSDRKGRRGMVLVGIAGFTVSVLLVGISLSAGIQGIIGPFTTMVAVIAARLIYGTFGSAAPPAAQAMVALRSTRETRVKALTMLGSAFGLGTILGPALAPYMVLPFVGLAGPAYIFAGLGSIVLTLAYRYLPSDDDSSMAHGVSVSYPSIGGAPAGASIKGASEDASDHKLPYRDPRIWPWILTGLASGHAQAMTGAAMAFLVIDRMHLDPGDMATQQAIGLVLMTGAGASLLVQWGIIPLFSMTPRVMILIGLAIAASGLALTAVAISLYSIAMAFALSCIGFGFVRPGFTSGASLAVDRSLQGAVAGRVTSVNGASFILGPSLGVGLYELWHPLPYLVASLAMLMLIPFASRALKLIQ
ncbi:MAG: MFS transporter [Sphingomonadaceae bacterium]